MALSDLTAAEVVTQLALEAHPEGGFFREVFRASELGLERGATALIYYLLEAGQSSRWHRLDCFEVWHAYAGAPMTVYLSRDGRTVETHVVGTDALDEGHTPQLVVPPETWMSAVSQGEWSLVGCQTAPAFEFAGFEMAPEGWVPNSDVGDPRAENRVRNPKTED